MIKKILPIFLWILHLPLSIEYNDNDDKIYLENLNSKELNVFIVRTGQERSGQIKTGQNRSAHVRTDHDRSGLVRTDQGR